MAENLEMSGLEFKIEEDSSQAVQSIQNLEKALEKLRVSTSRGLRGIDTSAKHIGNLTSALSKVNSSTMKSVSSLSVAVEKLGEASKVRFSSVMAKNIVGLMDSLSKINGDKLSKLNALSDGLKPLSELGRSKLTSFTNQLGKIPGVIKELDSVDLPKFTKQMKDLSDAMRPFADEMLKVGNGFSALPTKIQRLIKSTDRYNEYMSNASKSTTSVKSAFNGLKFGAASVAVREVSRAMATFVSKSNSFQENMNLFQASMGRFSEEALEFGKKASDILGLDISDWIRNEGIFQTLLTGFGQVDDRAAIMSKNLTQLGYDLSSFFNISVEDSMQKLQSGISGELEPLRRLGYDLSQAKLQAIAADNGINTLVSSMTQAEKAELRYYAIMTQVTTAQGDMARTLDAPANQLRILSAQVEMAARAIGNVFIPVLTAVLPYVTAFVRIVRKAADAIAMLFGFKPVEIDYSDVAESIGPVEEGTGNIKDNLGGAAGAAKKLKQYMAGFDELNVFSKPDPSAGGGAGGGAGGAGAGGGLGLDLPEYDFLKDRVSQQIDKIQKKLEDLLPWIGLIGAGIAAWNLKKKIDELGKFGKILKAALGAVTIGLEFMLVKGSIQSFLGEGGGIKDLLKAAVATALGSAILKMIFGPAGLYIGLATSVAAMITALTVEVGKGLNPDSFKANIVKIMSVALAGFIGFKIGGPTGAAISMLVTSAVILNLVHASAVKSGQLKGKSRLLSSITSALAGGLAGAGIGFVVGGGLPGAAIGFAIGATVSFAIQSVSINADKIKESFQGLGKPKVEIFGDDISEDTREKVGQLIGQFDKLQTEIGKIRFDPDHIITDADVSNIVGRFETIGTGIKKELEKSKKEAIDNFAELKKSLSEQDLSGVVPKGSFGAAVAGIEKYYKEQENVVNKGEEEVQKILEDAAKKGQQLEQSDWDKILEIQRNMEDTGIHEMSQSEVEYQTIMRNLKDESVDISIQQGSEIIKNAIKTRDDTISAAETQYTRVVDEAEKLHDAGAINDEVYEQMISAADKSRQQAIKDANEQYSGVRSALEEHMGDSAEYIDQETGEILSSLEVKVNKFKAFWNETLPNWWENDVKPWFTLERWKELGRSIVDGPMEKLEELKNKWGPKISGWWEESVKPWFTVERWKELGKSIVDGPMEKFEEFKQKWGAKISGWWEKDVKPWFTVERWKQLGQDAKDGFFLGLKDKFNKAKQWGEGVVTDVKEVLGIASPSKRFREIGEFAIQGFNNGFADKGDSFKDTIRGVLGSAEDEVLEFIKGVYGEEAKTEEGGSAFYQRLRNGLIAFLEAALGDITTFSGNVNAMIAKTETNIERFAYNTEKNFADMSRNSVDRINDIIFSLNSIPRHITTVHTIITKHVGGGGGSSSGSKSSAASVSMHAAGGYPDRGSLFIARENGSPEMVGTIGGKSAVANNEQIVGGIARGVSEANNDVVAAIYQLLDAIEEKELTVNVGDDAIGESYDRYNRKRGVRIDSGAFSNAY